MAVEIERLSECPEKNPSIPVKVTEMGNVVEIQYMSRRNQKATIRMLEGGAEYVELSTGEIKPCQKHDNRAQQKKSLYRTFKNVRAIINANVTNVNQCRWITLTYAENMTDTKRLYEDFKNFMKRMRYWSNQKGYGQVEYIVMCEPQGRGAWHCHVIMIFPKQIVAPYISNDTLSQLWGHGFVTVKKLDDVDNVGAYLTAYLGDMDLEDCLESGIMPEGKIKRLDADGSTKYYLKGARLRFYPANFNMYRCSRGIKKPIEVMMSQEEAEKKVSAGTLTFEQTLRLSDKATDFESIISKKQYNLAKKLCQSAT